MLDLQSVLHSLLFTPAIIFRNSKKGIDNPVIFIDDDDDDMNGLTAIRTLRDQMHMRKSNRYIIGPTHTEKEKRKKSHKSSTAAPAISTASTRSSEPGTHLPYSPPSSAAVPHAQEEQLHRQHSLPAHAHANPSPHHHDQTASAGHRTKARRTQGFRNAGACEQ